MKGLKKWGAVVVILALILSFAPFVLPTTYASAEEGAPTVEGMAGNETPPPAESLQDETSGEAKVPPVEGGLSPEGIGGEESSSPSEEGLSEGAGGEETQPLPEEGLPEGTDEGEAPVNEGTDGGELQGDGEPDEGQALNEAPTEETPPEEENTLARSQGARGTGTITVTFTVTGSKILETKEDHATAYEDGPWLTETVVIESGKTVTDVTNQLLDNPLNGRSVVIYSSTYGSFLNEISVDGKTNTGGITNGQNSYWYLLINGNSSEMGMDETILTEGDAIEWKFVNDPRFPLTVEQETADPPLELTPIPDYWTSFASSNFHNAAKLVDGTLEDHFELLWGKPYGEKYESPWGDYYATKSDFLIIGDHLYFAAANELFKLNRDGDIVAKEKLRNTIGFFGRLAYDYGLIVVPLDGGAVQAVDAKTMKTKWVAEAQDLMTIWKPNDEGIWNPVNYKIQSLATLLIADEVAYSTTTADGGSGPSPGGIIRAISMATGETPWQYQNSSSGYYWAGPVKIGKWIVIGNDGGDLEVIDSLTGKRVFENTVNVGAPIRSTIVHADGKLYFTSRDGTFHEIMFKKEDGSFGKRRSVQIGQMSTSTPTIYKGKAYVGGATEGGFPGKGVFLVVDLATMSIDFQHEVTGDVKATPLVIAGDKGDPYVFFTANNDAGALYVYDGKKVKEAYKPDQDRQNYSIFSPVTDGKGTIYYSNDSGNIFAIKMSVKEVKKPDTVKEPAGTKPVDGIPPTGETRVLLFKGFLLIALASGLAFAAKVNRKRKSTVSDDDNCS
ncbi:MAG TPA: PQQ-binding-like beta-propeller repeat protein [Clostridiaceae bacterium]|nr:PQQ-binding-like beta-propeller repeat protein [Clostridiaceae bacterium]